MIQGNFFGSFLFFYNLLVMARSDIIFIQLNSYYDPGEDSTNRMETLA